MKTLWIVIFGLFITLAISALIERQSSPSNAGGLPKTALSPSVAANYSVELHMTMKKRGEAKTEGVLLLGTLAQATNPNAELITEWVSLNKFEVAGVPVDNLIISSMLHKPSISSVEGRGMSHLIAKDFPEDYMGLQLNLLEKIIIPEEPADHMPLVQTESDEMGRYNVRYSFDEEKKITKTWIQSHLSNIKVDSKYNSIVYGFDQAGTLKSAVGHIVLHSSEPEQIEYDTQLSVQRLEGSHLPLTALVDKVNMRRLSVQDIHTIAAKETVSSDPESALSLAEALSKLDLLTSNSEYLDELKIARALDESLLSGNANAIHLITDKILAISERDESSKRRVAVLFGALSASHDSVVADALSVLAQKSCPDSYCKQQAIVSMSFVGAPSAVNAQQMLEIAESSPDPDLQSSAFLAAGNIGGKLGGNVPELSNALIKDYNQEKDDTKKSNILMAMGNHGSSDYIGTLEKSAQSEDILVRASALYGMRNLASDRTTGVLVEAAQREDSLIVNSEILGALAYRNLTGDDYSKIADKFAKLENKDLQDQAVGLLLSGYRAHDEAAEASLKRFQTETSLDEVKTYIATELKAR
ncbi:MAG: HEAT repeat domain-containing protein [Chitinophagaceae bacterium]|nr:HEAT repeat domain-containing protein [Oligoflexus sp.]